MKAKYLCPTCYTLQNKANKRRIFSLDCCLQCSNFVKTATTIPQYNWFNASRERKKLNPRHPRVSAPLIAKIIKARRLEGKYSGDNIISPLSKMREELNKLMGQELGRQEKYRVLFNSLRILDDLYWRKTDRVLQVANLDIPLPNQRISDQNVVMSQYVGHFGKALERVIELALIRHADKQAVESRQHNLFPLYEMASELVFLNEIIENFVCLWNRGNLIIGRDDWDFELVQEDQVKLDNMKKSWSHDDMQQARVAFKEDGGPSLPEEYKRALKELSKGTASRGILNDPDMEEFIISIDDEHRKLFGHSFSERLLAILYLAELQDNIRKDWAFEDNLVEFLCEHVELEKETAKSLLDGLSLTGSGIEQENAYPFHFSRIFRLIRRPLPMFQIGNRNVYYVSTVFLVRSFLHINAEYTDGSYPELKNTTIEKLIKKLNNQYTSYFVRERVAKVLSDLGFTVEPHVKRIGRHNLESICGELDIIALNTKRDHLLIGECKFRVTQFISVREIRHELSYYTDTDNGHISKFQKKLKWITEHKREVLGFLGHKGQADDVICIPVFITNFYTPVSELITDIEFVTEINLSSWAQKFN